MPDFTNFRISVVLRDRIDCRTQLLKWLDKVGSVVRKELNGPPHTPTFGDFPPCFLPYSPRPIGDDVWEYHSYTESVPSGKRGGEAPLILILSGHLSMTHLIIGGPPEDDYEAWGRRRGFITPESSSLCYGCHIRALFSERVNL